MKKRYISTIFICVGIVVIILAVRYFSPAPPVCTDCDDTASTTGTSKILVYFIDNQNEATTTSCGITRGVVRKMKKTDDIYSDSLRTLFKGPDGDEQISGLVSTFQPGTNASAEMKPLSDYFNKVTFDGVTAFVDFKSDDALNYLNSAVCMQESVKRPIENTLRQFPDIQRIEYSINGITFIEWDA